MSDLPRGVTGSSRALILGPLLVGVITGVVLAARGTAFVGVGVGAAVGFAAALIAVVFLRQVFGRRNSGS